MTELDSLISNLTTPEGNSIVLQSLEHMPESTEPAPRRKRRKAQAAPEPQLAAEVLADEVLPDATAARAPEQTVPELGAAATPELAVTEAHPDGANSALPEPEASLRAQSILQQLITAVQSQEAVVATQADKQAATQADKQAAMQADKQAAMQADQTMAASAAEPALTVAEPHASGPELEEGPELSAAELERYNRMLLKVGDPCPACGHGTLVLRQSGKVAFLGCSCFPRCKLRYFTRTVSPVHTLKLLTSLCPQCGAPLAVKKGRYGLFIGCSDYPNCTYSPKEAAEENAVECPQCHQGVLRQRRSSSGKIFYGCECYPQCDFKLMGAPYVKTCPECGFPLRFKKKVKAGIALVCGNPKCPTRKSRKYDLLQD